MGILKNIGEIFKCAFGDVPFIKSFMEGAGSKKNYEKEIAENTAKINKNLQEMNEKQKGN